MERFDKFTINEDGEDKEYSVLSTFKIFEKEYSYIIYTDYSIDENKKMKINISKYLMEKGKIKLNPITEENEVKSIEEYLRDIEKHYIKM